jgi:hypothetical protein
MTAGEEKSPYGYNRGDEKPYKHQSDEAEAHFVRIGGEYVGKCPKDISVAEAHKLLAKAIPYGELPDGHPKCFFAVHRGVPYTTKWTHRGQDVHGFPWRFREPGGMPRSVRTKLRAWAEKDGCAEVFDRWMKRYGESPEVRS